MGRYLPGSGAGGRRGGVGAQPFVRAINSIAAAGLLRERIDPLEQRLDELSRRDFAPPPLITGDDLVAAGLSPGKLFKRILDDVYDAQLEDRVTTKPAALEMALRIAGGLATP